MRCLHVQKPSRKRGKGGNSSDEESDEEASSRKKAKKGKKVKTKGGEESDEDIEEVGSDDDALERILERGMTREEGESEDEGEEGEASEGNAYIEKYDSLMLNSLSVFQIYGTDWCAVDIGVRGRRASRRMRETKGRLAKVTVMFENLHVPLMKSSSSRFRSMG